MFWKRLDYVVHIIHHSTLDSEHDWEPNLRIQWRNQQTRTPDNQYQIKGGVIFSPICADISS